VADRVVGIDIGGSKVATSVGDRSGNVIARTRRPTEPSGRPQDDVSRLVSDVRELVARADHALSDVIALGVSAPGPLDPSRRRLLGPPNLPGWHDVPLADLLEAALGVKVRLENDANAAALAEWRFGAARGFRHVVYLTMSTGVGAGLILDGQLYRGQGGVAGEVGHARVDWDPAAERCACGNRGCLEAYVGGASWARRLRERTPPSSQVAVLAGGAQHVTPEHLLAAARCGDSFALAEMERFNDYVARAIVNLGFSLAPELVVLGTIASAAGDELCLQPVRQRVRDQLWSVMADGLRIEAAELGDELPYRAGLGVALDALDV
jgi:glucokinase